MSLFQFVENQLGSIFTWPIVILKYLFIDPPTYWTTLALINFFYGNRVPCNMAVQLFQACNGKADVLLVELFFYH